MTRGLEHGVSAMYLLSKKFCGVDMVVVSKHEVSLT